MAAYYHPSTPRFSDYFEQQAQFYEQQAERLRPSGRYPLRRPAYVDDAYYEYAPRAPAHRSHRGSVYTDYTPEPFVMHHVPEPRAYFDHNYEYEPAPAFARAPQPQRQHPDELEKEFLRDLASQDYDAAFRAWKQKYASTAPAPAPVSRAPNYDSTQNYERPISRYAPTTDERRAIRPLAIAPCRSESTPSVQSRRVAHRPVLFTGDNRMISRDQLPRNAREVKLEAARTQAASSARRYRLNQDRAPDVSAVLNLFGLKPSAFVSPAPVSPTRCSRNEPAQADIATAFQQRRVAEKEAFFKTIHSSPVPSQTSPKPAAHPVRFSTGEATIPLDPSKIDIAQVLELLQVLQGPQDQQGSSSSQQSTQKPVLQSGATASVPAPQISKAVSTSTEAPVKSRQTNAPATYTYAAPASVQLERKITPVPSPVAPSLEPITQTISRPTNAAAEAEQLKEAIRASLESPTTRAPSPTHSITSSTRTLSPSLSSISSIEESFVNLNFDFSFPSHPEFAPNASSSAPELLYTHTNAPIRQYEHALTGLLTRLDAVESDGDEEVRFARKELVLRIEGALDRLDALKREAWVKRYGSEGVEPVQETGPSEPVIDSISSVETQPEVSVAAAVEEEPQVSTPTEEPTVVFIDVAEEVGPVEDDQPTIMHTPTPASEGCAAAESTPSDPELAPLSDNTQSESSVTEDSATPVDIQMDSLVKSESEPAPVLIIPDPAPISLSAEENLGALAADGSPTPEIPAIESGIPSVVNKEAAEHSLASSTSSIDDEGLSRTIRLLSPSSASLTNTSFPPRTLSHSQFLPTPPRQTETDSVASSVIDDADLELELQSVSSENSIEGATLEVNSDGEDVPASMEESKRVEDKLDFVMI